MDNKQTYIINFKANAQGVDQVKKQFESILQMEGVKDNLTKPMQEAWAKLQGRMTAYLQQMSSELAKSNPDIAMLKTLDKGLTDIVNKANKFNVALQGITLPADVSAAMGELTKKINAANTEITRLQNSNLKITEGLDSRTKTGFKKGSAAEDQAFTQIETDVLGIAEIKDVLQIAGGGWEDYKKAVDEAIKSEKLSQEQIERAKATIKETESRMRNLAEAKRAEIAVNQSKIEGQKLVIQGYAEEKTRLLENANAASELTEAQQALNTATQNNATSINNLAVQQHKTKESLTENVKNTNTAVTATNNFSEAQNKAVTSTSGLQSTLGKAAKQVLTYGTIISLLRRAYTRTISTITDMDKALTDMAIVTSMNREEAWALTGDLQDLAKTTGMTTAEIANITTKFLQQGKSISQATELTEAAAKAATIAGISGEQSVDLLTNAMNGFQLSASKAMEVSDKFAALAASSATDYEELATALSKVAAQANLAGMSMDFTLGLLAKGIEVTREAPETIGTALKTVVARMRELSDYGKTLEEGMDVNRVATALSNVGIELMDETNQFRDLEDVLTDVGKQWDTLNKNQQANIAVAMAGTRQQSRFIAMMQDFERTQELVDISANSVGATLAQQAEYMGGMEAATNNLTVAWETLTTSLVKSEFIIGLVNILSGGIDLLTTALTTTEALVPILTVIALLSAGGIANKIQEMILQKRINELKREETIIENEQTINDAKARIEQNKELNNEKLLAKTKELSAKKEITAEKLQQKEILQTFKIQRAMQLHREGGLSYQAALQQANLEFADEITRTELEYNNALAAEQSVQQEISTIEIAMRQTRADNLLIKQKELENQKLQNEQYGMFSGLLSKINGLNLIWNGIKSIGLLFRKKENQELTKNIALTNADTKATQKNTVAKTENAIAGSASSVAHWPFWGWAVALALLATIGIVLAVNAAQQNNQTSAVEQTTEKIKELQVEIYNLGKSQETVSKLGDEFETLNNQIVKSADSIERMKEIIQEINDEAGEEVITGVTTEEQLRQIQEYENLLEIQKADKINKQAKTLSEGYDKATAVKTVIVDDVGTEEYVWSDEQEQAAKELGYNLYDANIYSYIPEIVERAGQIYTSEVMESQSNREAVRQIAAMSLDLSELMSTQLQEAVLSASTSNFATFFPEGEIDFSVLQEWLSADILQPLDDALESGSLYEIEMAFSSLDATTQQYLSNSDPMFALFSNYTAGAETVTGTLYGLGKALDKAGIKLENLNEIQSDIGDENFQTWLSALKTAADDTENIANTEEAINQIRQKGLSEYIKLQKQRKQELQDQKELYQTQYGSLSMEQQLAELEKKNIDELTDYEIAMKNKLHAQIMYNKAEEAKADIEATTKSGGDQKYDENSDKWKEANQDLAKWKTELEEADGIINNFNSDVAVDTNSIFALAESMGAMSTTEFSDKLTSFTSAMEKMATAADWANLSIQEQLELLKEYPALSQYVADGTLTVAERYEFLGEQAQDIRADALHSMDLYKTSVLNSLNANSNKTYTIDGMQINFAQMFDDDQMRNQLLSLNTSEKDSLIEQYAKALYGDDWQKYWEAAQTDINNYIGAAENYTQQKLLSDTSVAELINDGVAEAFANATNVYNKQAEQLEKYDDILNRVDEKSTAYEEAWQDRNALLIEHIKEGDKEIDSIQQQMDKEMEGTLSTGESYLEYIEIINGKVFLKQSEAWKKLSEADQNRLQLALETAETYGEQIYEIQTQQAEDYEKLAESYIEMAKKQQEADIETKEKEIEALEERKEAYEKYFEEIDALQDEEEFAQDRESLIKQIQALSGGADAASKQKIKELQAELNDLDKEQLEAQKEQQREALLNSMDEQIDTANEELDAMNETLDSLDDGLNKILMLMEGTATEEEYAQYYDWAVSQLGQERVNELGNKKYATGGLVDYTGPAWVDGTKSNPEAFLSSQDTRNIQNLLEQLELNRDLGLNNSVQAPQTNNNVVIENITVQTNELNNNQDWRNAGQVLAEEFAAQQKKRGINQNVNTRYRR